MARLPNTALVDIFFVRECGVAVSCRGLAYARIQFLASTMFCLAQGFMYSALRRYCLYVSTV